MPYAMHGENKKVQQTFIHCTIIANAIVTVVV